MEEPTLKDRLSIGEEIFYYDGLTQWDIETVVSVNKAEKYAVLSNNAKISRYPSPDGTFKRVELNPGYFNSHSLIIKRATPELKQLRQAILSKKLIQGYLYQINGGILKVADGKRWDHWSNSLQERLICLAGHIAKGLQETPLDDEEKALLSTEMGDKPIEVKPTKKSKRRK